MVQHEADRGNVGGAGMSTCDHSAMTTERDAPDVDVKCPGCGERIGKYTAGDGAVLTTYGAWVAYQGALDAEAERAAAQDAV